jgi:hypothetical protein
MTSWDDVKAGLRAGGLAVMDRGDWIGLELSGQRLRVDRVARADGPEVVVLSAEVCAGGAIPAHQALAESARMIEGALVLFRGDYLVREALSLPTLVLDELERVVHAVAACARRLRAQARTGASPYTDGYAH